MHKRRIPATNEDIPVIGLGTWQVFDPPALDDEHLAPLREVLRTFHAAGGRVIDSSPMYGRSESVAGRLSAELNINADLFIATKVWTRGREAGERQMRNSLTELRRQNLELMQIHNLLDWRTHLKTLRDWKERGTFRYIGITHYQVSAFDELERIIRSEKLDFVQLPYSIATPQAEQRLLPAAKERGVAVLVNRPFEGGGLFGRVRGKPLPGDLEGTAQSWGQAFLKWILANDAVTCVIPATSNPRHMTDNLGAGSGDSMTDELRRKLASSI